MVSAVVAQLPYNSVKENLAKLGELEKKNCKNIDEVADCFGKLLESIFNKDGNNKAVAWFGYHIGRYIYIIDAYKDIEKDLKTKSYNPFIAMHCTELNKEDFKESVKISLTFTLSEISNAYNLLDIKKNKDIYEDWRYFHENKKASLNAKFLFIHCLIQVLSSICYAENNIEQQ